VRQIEIEPTFESWQAAARTLLREGVSPDQIVWVEAMPRQATLPGVHSPAGIGSGPITESRTPSIRVPRKFIELARRVAGDPDPGRWSLLYEVLWRLDRENRDLLKMDADPQVSRLLSMAGEAKSSRPEPRRSTRTVVPYHADRVASGAQRWQEPSQRQTSKQEAARSEALKQEPARSEAMSAAPFVPADAGLEQLKAAAARCTGCDLHRHATQTVFGQGPMHARIVLVGEQPGDQEDRQGAPFVGPAGEVLDRALAEVGLKRQELYVTNAVKHFKFVDTGKRRIHQTPRPAEVAACLPWIEAELSAITPDVVVCLGATAARALLGPDFRLLKERGRFFSTRWAPKTVATLHPSAVLRGEDEAVQARLYGMLVEDLRLAATAA
jgi:uracil-DNA glycosylase